MTEEREREAIRELPIYMLGGADGHTVVRCGIDEYMGQLREHVHALASAGADPWRVARDERDGVEISTVFLGLFSRGDDYFETMTFSKARPDLDGERWQYGTWDEAVAGHKRIVSGVEDMLAGRYIATKGGAP